MLRNSLNHSRRRTLEPTRLRSARVALCLLLALLLTALGSLGSAPAQAVPKPDPQATTSAKPEGKRDKQGMYVTPKIADGSAAPRLWAESWMVASLDSGQVLSEKDPEKKLWPASVLKLLTGLALIDQFPTAADREKKYKATRAEENVDGTRVGLEAGHSYTIDSLFHAMLMMSANDAAYALGQAAGGQAKGLALLNKKARAIGMTGTTAKTFNGLDAKGQAMTCHDLVVLAKHFTQNKYLMQVAGTTNYRFDTGLSDKQKKTQAKKQAKAKKAGKTFTGTPAFMEVSNHTKIAGVVPGGLGLKNGYTIKARGSFVAVVKRGGKTFVAAILKATDQPRQPAIDMLDWAFKQTAPKPVDTIDFEAIDQSVAKVGPIPTAQNPAGAAAQNPADNRVFGDSAALWGGGLMLVIVVLGIGFIVGKRMRRASRARHR
ncbi:serine hydrolase [Brevibacterium sp. 50QC2O2]|uniref:D-alanyl-D-alanine carboxypeptidase family protein n=1 Tax=Brevibacterium TaxID=1696 RepID=UPI00211B9DD8|nr:serine hydrolase [Brevibacterium sp. 68QC2CO]MCQ9388978.1 serine hydrolase [Brevibacterium sp. 50QC2O2]